MTVSGVGNEPKGNPLKETTRDVVCGSFPHSLLTTSKLTNMCKHPCCNLPPEECLTHRSMRYSNILADSTQHMSCQSQRTKQTTLCHPRCSHTGSKKLSVFGSAHHTQYQSMAFEPRAKSANHMKCILYQLTWKPKGAS